MSSSLSICDILWLNCSSEKSEYTRFTMFLISEASFWFSEIQDLYISSNLSFFPFSSNNETQSIENVSPDEFVNIMNEIKILDVRNEGEINSSSLDNSIKIPLKTLENNLKKLNQNNKYYVHCAGGYRSMIAASLMKKNGFNNLVNVSKGYSGIKKCLINI